MENIDEASGWRLKMEKEMENKMEKKNSLGKGIACILTAAFFFSMMTMFVRLAGNLPTFEKAFFRNFVAVFVAIIAILRSKDGFKKSIKIENKNIALLFFRCLFGTFGLICNFYAIDKINIADANMLNKLSPFFAIIMSIFIIKEIPKKNDIIAVICAFVGAFFVIKPSGNAELLPALIGLLGGFLAGSAYTCVRLLGVRGVKGPVIVLAFSLFSCLTTFPLFLLDFEPMSIEQFLCLLAAGLVASIAQFAITAAYKYAPAREISVFDYSQIVFATIWGACIFGEIPDIYSFIGYGIIFLTVIIRWLYLKRVTRLAE